MDASEVAAQAKGWLHDDEGPMLVELAGRCEGPYLEVGSYAGKSACWIGQAAKKNGTVLFAVDHHRGSPEMEPSHAHYDETVWVDGRHDTIYHLRRNLARADLENTVIPVVGDSMTVGQWWTIPVGFCFIDGGHDRKTCMSDFRLFGPWVRTGGYLLFHDTNTPGPKAAIEAAREEGGWHELAMVGCTTILRRDG